MTTPAFFIPEASDPKAAWDRYVQAVGLTSDETEALYEIEYLHDGDRYEVRVGERRRHYPRKTGPRAAATGPMRDIGHGPRIQAR